MEVPGFVLVDTGPLVRQESTAYVLLALELQYALGPELLELGQLVLAVYSVPRPAAVVACLERVIG